MKLNPHRLILNEAGELTIQKESGVVISVPRVYSAFMTAASSGQSLTTLALGLQKAQGKGRFASLARFLSFLNDNDLLADKQAIRLAESLKPDFVWRESVAFDELASFELIKRSGGSRVPLFAQLMFVTVLFLLGAILLLRLVAEVRLGQQAWVPVISATPVLIAYVLTFFVGRSARAIVQFLTSSISSGHESGLYVRLDAVSLSLAPEDISRGRGHSAFIFGSLAALLWLASPITTMAMRSWSSITGVQAVDQFVLVFTLLLLLADLSPFRRSPLTDWLRAAYNSAESKRDGGRENLFRFVHVASCLVWTAGLLLWAWGPARHTFVFLKANLDLSTRASQISTGLLFLLLLIIAFSFVDDLVNGIVPGLSDKTSRVRRLWKRRSETTKLQEALKSQGALSREDLEALPLLRQLDRDTRAKLLANANVVEIRAGNPITRQGDTDRTLFIVLNGRFAVAKKSASRGGGQSRRRVVAWLEPGAVFGEAGFFLGLERTADVVAMENSQALAIPHDEAINTLDPSKSEDLQVRIWFLQAFVGSELFRGLPAEALDALIFAGQRKYFRAGEKVMSEGEAGDACYFMIQGQASVVQKQNVINRMKAGGVFGEIALMHPGSLRTATVVADSDLLTVSLTSQAFWDLLSRHLPVAVEIERLAEKRLARTS